MQEPKKYEFLDDTFYTKVRNILEEARKRTYRHIQSEMVLSYWQIGKMIVEKQGGKERAKYGDGLVEELSNRMTKDFGKGFTISNLKRMRKFYLLFQKGAPLRHQLSWTHYRLLLSLDDENAMNFYIKEAVEGKRYTSEIHSSIG